jgi:hypothetical protein
VLVNANSYFIDSLSLLSPLQFVLQGDMNSDPIDGTSTAINKYMCHNARIQQSVCMGAMVPSSGGHVNARLYADAEERKADPSHWTHFMGLYVVFF